LDIPNIILNSPNTGNALGDFIQLIRNLEGLDVRPSKAEVRTVYNLLCKRYPGTINAAKQSALDKVMGNPVGSATGFLYGTGNLAFRHFDRETISIELLVRILVPAQLGQGNHPLCGPHVLVSDFCLKNPLGYAQFVIGLAENCQGDISVNTSNTLTVSISATSGILGKHDHFNKYGYRKVPQADYIALASLREDSCILPYRGKMTNRTLEGATTAGELVDWMKEVGYSGVHDKTYQFTSRLAMITKPASMRDKLYGDATQKSVSKAASYLAAGYSVFVCGAGNLAHYTLGHDRKSYDSNTMLLFGGHWMRATRIQLQPSGVDFRIATWGEFMLTDTRVPWSKMESWYRGFVCGLP
jgi:hypothetical protein